MITTSKLAALVTGVGTIAVTGKAAEASQEEVFRLGTCQVYGQKATLADSTLLSIDREALESRELVNIAEAASQVPGVTLTRFGGRNEESIWVRGFDRRQVPLYIDGVPVYVPYDGYVDLARFTTADVALVTVSKGYSSVLSGPNAMGGAINVVTRRPARPLDGELSAGLFTGNGREGALNLGAARAHAYAQLGLSYREFDYFELPGAFRPTKGEDGGRRDNSAEKDWRVSGKLAWTPTGGDEYAFGFLHQEGEKGNPVYAGYDPTMALKYWRWPLWDKDTYYLVSNTRLGGTGYLKPRLYYDTYQNSLAIYDDATYTTQKKKSSSTSRYEDYSYGASVEAGQVLAVNRLSAALHHKLDHHDEHNLGGPRSKFEDRTESVALEDTWKPLSDLEVQAGAAYDERKVIKAVDTNTAAPLPLSHFSELDPEGGVFWSPLQDQTFHLTVARKSRFPTIKDRYSYKFGTAIPNPQLRAESAMHYELGYSAKLEGGFHVGASAYVSQIHDAIQSVDRVAFDAKGSPLSQNQNIARARSQGVELETSWEARDKTLKLGGTYTFLDRDNLSSPAVRPTDTPRHSGTLFADCKPLTWLSITPSLMLASDRYAYSDGRMIGGYAVTSLKATLHLGHGSSLSVGARNLFDKLYQLNEGYPEAGRSFFCSLRHDF